MVSSGVRLDGRVEFRVILKYHMCVHTPSEEFVFAQYLDPVFSTIHCNICTSPSGLFNAPREQQPLMRKHQQSREIRQEL